MNRDESMKPLLQQDDGPQFCAHPIRRKAGDESTRFILSIRNPSPADSSVSRRSAWGLKVQSKWGAL